MGPSTEHLYNTTLAEVEAAKMERLEALRRETVKKYLDAEKAGKGKFRLHETRNTLDNLREEVRRDRGNRVSICHRVKLCSTSLGRRKQASPS